MFVTLLADIRLGVISRVFKSQIRRGPGIEQNQSSSEQPAAAGDQNVSKTNTGTDKKKKRHRH